MGLAGMAGGMADGTAIPFRRAMAEAERRLLAEALVRNRCDKRKTARELEVSRSWLFMKINEYGLRAG